MKASHDLTRRHFGELIAISRAGNDSYGHVSWLCHCSCGKSVTTRADRLLGGNAKSCGHMIGVVHGMKNTRTYKSWTSMIQRCLNQNDTGFVNYGGRGITVCPEWREFMTFYRDMGERPEGCSLDRVDTNGNYEPTNCRWATRAEQNNNKRPYKKRVLV